MTENDDQHGKTADLIVSQEKAYWKIRQEGREGNWERQVIPLGRFRLYCRFKADISKMFYHVQEFPLNDVFTTATELGLIYCHKRFQHIWGVLGFVSVTAEKKCLNSS